MQSSNLQSKIKAKLASADQSKANDMLKAAEQKAAKLRTII